MTGQKLQERFAGAIATFSAAPCSSDPQLFDSIEYRDHLDARQVCAGCLSRDVCRDVALADRQADGTYGGALFTAGRIILEIR